MNSVEIYGIKNCDTMKKAIAWLNKHEIPFVFHDYKKLGIDRTSIESWLSQVSWDELINKRGTTWRKLPDADKENIDNDKAIQLMIENTSLIKRPILVKDNRLKLGFKEEVYDSIFHREH